MTTNTLSRQLDAAFAQAAEATAAPGVQAVLLRRGELVWAGNHGLADIDRQVPVSGDTMFCLASFGKLVIAAAALRQVERGLLDLDAPVAKYVGDDVPGTSVVTTRMLLQQTSGYPDIYTTPAVAPLLPMGAPDGTTSTAYDPDRPFTWELLAPGFREPVDPGQHWEYSNAGYILLARVLVGALGGEQAMQEACSEFIHTPVDGPAITDDALTLWRSPRAAALLARGYDPLPDGSFRDAYADWAPAAIPTDLFGLPFGDGMFAGTALGAARLLDGLFVGATFLHPESVDEMVTPSPQSLACPGLPESWIGYGAGTVQETVAGRQWHGHAGMYGGFSSNGATDRSRGVTLMTVANGTWLPSEEHPERVTTASGAVWQALATAYAESCS